MRRDASSGLPPSGGRAIAVRDVTRSRWRQEYVWHSRSFGDLEERKHWSKYWQAFEQMVQNTSTKRAPWWVIPADHKWVTRTLVAAIIARSSDGLGVGFPKVSEKDRLRLAAARTDLLADA
jgi:hypothetical protein